MPTAFISYSHHDREFVEKLVGDLERAGVDVWWDRDLQVGVPWLQGIEKAVGAARFLLLVLSPEAVESAAVLLERDMGLIRTLHNQMTLIPMLYKDCAIPLALSHDQLGGRLEEVGVQRRTRPGLSSSQRSALRYRLRTASAYSSTDFLVTLPPSSVTLLLRQLYHLR